MPSLYKSVGSAGLGYPDIGQTFYLVDTNYRTAAQGWTQSDHTGPLDLWAEKNPGRVFYGAGAGSGTGVGNQYASDSAAVQAAVDAMVDYRGDTLFWTPGNYSLGTAIAVNVPAARWLGTAYKSPKYGCSPAVRNTTITATVADVFADGATPPMANMEVAYLNFVPLTAEDIWNLSVVQNGLHFHDFIFDTVSVATSAATQFLVSAGLTTQCLFDNFSWFSIAPQGPVFEVDVPSNLVLSNFFHSHYSTGGTYAASLLDVTGATADSVSLIGGRGQVSVGAGAGAVTALVTLAAQTASTTVLSVFDFRGSIGYATASTLITTAGDAGEVDLSDCWISVIKGGAGGQGTAYTG